MGRLLSTSDFVHKDPWGNMVGYLYANWYFEDANWNSTTQRWEFDVSASFPYGLAIHRDEFENGKGGTLRVSMRKFVQRQLIGDVVFYSDDRNYMTGREPYRVEVKHGYYFFNFEEEEDYILFKMNFAHLLSDPADRHPAFP